MLTVAQAAQKIAAEINAAPIACSAEYCELNEEVVLDCEGRKVGVIRAIERTKKIDGGKRYLGIFDFEGVGVVAWLAKDIALICSDVIASK